VVEIVVVVRGRGAEEEERCLGGGDRRRDKGGFGCGWSRVLRVPRAVLSLEGRHSRSSLLSAVESLRSVRVTVLDNDGQQLWQKRRLGRTGGLDEGNARAAGLAPAE
jgi:hypothetical protein